MPLIEIADTTCFYRLTGRDDAPVLMLAHSLGQDHGMWDPQIADLSDHFRVLRYDIRGHGASGVTAGDYRIEQLAADALALADALGIDRFAFCGVSLGGMIGQWLAANAPQRVTAAVLANTSATADAARMQARREAVLSGGMASIAEMVMSRFFSPRLLASNSPIVASARRTLLATSPVGYAGCCAAIRDMDLTPALSSIRIPILIVNGELDVSLAWRGLGEVLAREIAGARVVHLDAAHLSNIERPRAFTSAVLQFLAPPAADSDTHATGMRVRRGVLGDAHVDRAVANAAQTSEAFQDLITRFAWGTVWSRPGLDVRTRRLMVLAITAAMGRWEEFRLHARTGFAHELEWCDVEETLIHTAIYAGVPAANTAFHAAADERPVKEGD
jgi:3-oxoadipate enol-lactonase / 4-carboxymuconolactone decarboxylase